MATATLAGGARVKKKRASRRPLMPRAAWWGTCIALTVLFLYPLYVMISQSLKNPQEAAQVPPTLFPHEISGAKYSALSHTGGINVFEHIGNSAVVSIGATLATVLLSTLGGYASRSCASRARSTCRSGCSSCATRSRRSRTRSRRPP